MTKENLGDLLEAEYERLGSSPTPGELYEASMCAVARAESKRLCADKTPQNVHWITRIVEEMPQAKFVCMLREPYGFMLSYKFQGRRIGGEHWKQFQRLFHPIVCACVWRAYARSSFRTAREHPDRVLLVRFSEVQSDPAAVLERVQRHLGVEVEPLHERVPAANTSFPEGERPELSPADVFWMTRISGKYRKRLGTPPRSAGFHPLAVAAPCLTLPVWAARNFGPFRRALSGSPLRYAMRLTAR